MSPESRVNLGNWLSAIVKSIFLVGLLYVVYSILRMPPPQYSYLLYLLALIGILGLPYLLLSIAGWLVIGFPAHWAICKYTKGGYFYYILAAIAFSLMLAILDVGLALLFGSVALLQALVFRFYVSNQKHNKVLHKNVKNRCFFNGNIIFFSHRT